MTTEPALNGAFAKVVGIDPSPQMVAQAQKHARELPDGIKPPKYVQGNVENMDFLQDGSVDLVTVGACAAAHASRLFLSHRALRPGRPLVRL